MSINKPRHERSSSMYDKTSLSNTGAQSLRGTFNQEDVNPLNSIQINQSEIQRMKNSLLNPHLNNPNILRNQELQAIFKQRTSTWKDAKGGKKNADLQKQYERFVKEESLRQKIDQEEALIRNDVKARIIKKANDQIFENNNDRIKSFKTKMLISDALMEREEQIQITQAQKDYEKRKEEFFHQQILQNIEKEQKKEQLKIDELQKKKDITAQILKEQHQIQKQSYIDRWQQEYEEGQMFKKMAEQHLIDEKIAKDKVVQKNKNMVQEFVRINEEHKVIKKKLQDLEDLEESKIQKYAQQKENMEAKRKQRSQDIFQAKQETRQKMIDIQVAALAKMKNNEDSRIANQVAETQKKNDDEFRKKQEKFQQDLKDQKAAWEYSIKIKQEQKARQDQEDKDFIQNFHQMNQKLNQDEIDTQKLRNLLLKQQQAKHKQQQAERQEQRVREFQQELKESEQIQMMIGQEQIEFQNWALQCIDEWRADGKNILPLLKEFMRKNKEI